MHPQKKYYGVVAAVSLALGSFPIAHATNGMNPEGNGVKSRAMGGAGVAIANETASVVTNPAAIVDVGHRMDVSFGLFSPSPRGYTHTGGNPAFNGSQLSESNVFAIPYFGMTFPINNQSAWALNVNANGGMNTNYARNFHSGLAASGGTGVNLEQIFFNASYGHKLTPNVSVGVTAIAAYQRLSATGLQAFNSASSSPSNLTNVGDDSSTGFGVKVGIQARVSDTVSLGTAYQPKIDMGKLDKYKGLFADQGDLDIAGTFTAGLAWKFSPKFTLAFDYHYIDYKDVPAIGNSTSKFPSLQFGASDGPGFGWNSINVYKLGLEYARSDSMTLRIGWNHGENPITSEEISTAFLAPGIITDHLTLGGTFKLDKQSELSFNFVHSFKNTASGPFSASFGGGTMNVEMTQNFIELGYSKLF